MRKFKKLILSSLNGLLYIFFPRICAACNHSLYKNEDVICTSCLYHLAKTNTHTDSTNTIYKTFWGRVPISNAASYLFFTKQGKVQHLIHQLKYKKREDVGIYLGVLYGNELKICSPYNEVDLIIPVPLHPLKKRKRGYNQSEVFAKGLSQSMNIPVNTNSLARKNNNASQTKYSRYNRWENIKELFFVPPINSIQNKNILLVDDVITTGATLEACASALLNNGASSVCIATIAYTAK